MASSGFVEWLRSGRKGLYGLGCLRRVDASCGTSSYSWSAFLTQQKHRLIGYTVDQVTGQNEHILDDVGPLSC